MLSTSSNRKLHSLAMSLYIWKWYVDDNDNDWSMQTKPADLDPRRHGTLPSTLLFYFQSPNYYFRLLPPIVSPNLWSSSIETRHLSDCSLTLDGDRFLFRFSRSESIDSRESINYETFSFSLLRTVEVFNTKLILMYINFNCPSGELLRNFLANRFHSTQKVDGKFQIGLLKGCS